MIGQKFPPGWDEERVREVLAHYEGQTEDEQFAEIEAAREAEGMTLMAIPTELVPEVRCLTRGSRVPESREDCQTSRCPKLALTAGCRASA